MSTYEAAATLYRYPRHQRPATTPADDALLWIARNGRPNAGLVQAAIETSERHGDPLGDNPMRRQLLELAPRMVWGRYPARFARKSDGHTWRPIYIAVDGRSFVAPVAGAPWREATPAERAAFQPRRAADQHTTGRIFDDSLYLTEGN